MEWNGRRKTGMEQWDERLRQISNRVLSFPFSTSAIVFWHFPATFVSPRIALLLFAVFHWAANGYPFVALAQRRPYCVTILSPLCWLFLKHFIGTLSALQLVRQCQLCISIWVYSKFIATSLIGKLLHIFRLSDTFWVLKYLFNIPVNEQLIDVVQTTWWLDLCHLIT